MTTMPGALLSARSASACRTRPLSTPTPIRARSSSKRPGPRPPEADDLIIAVFSTLRTAKGSVGLLPRHIELVKELAEARKGRVVVLSFGSPYFLRHFPEAGAYLCLYRASLPAQEAAAKAVFGEIDVIGPPAGIHPRPFSAATGTYPKK